MSDTPRDADGAKLCAWCGAEIRQSGIGRSKDYCRRSCRQRAYESRKQREVVVAAVAAAVVRRDSSRVETPHPEETSRDETRGVPPEPVPARPVPPQPEPEPAPGLFPAAPARQKRRRLLPPPPGTQRAEQVPLLGFGFGSGVPDRKPEDADGE